MSAALVVGRERMRPLRYAIAIDVGQPCLASVRPWEPAEEVIERAVLHHHDDDVVERRRPGRWLRRKRGATPEGERANAGSGAAQDCPPREPRVRRHRACGPVYPGNEVPIPGFTSRARGAARRSLERP